MQLAYTEAQNLAISTLVNNELASVIERASNGEFDSAVDMSGFHTNGMNTYIAEQCTSTTDQYFDTRDATALHVLYISELFHALLDKQFNHKDTASKQQGIDTFEALQHVFNDVLGKERVDAHIESYEKTGYPTPLKIEDDFKGLDPVCLTESTGPTTTVTITLFDQYQSQH